MQPSTFFAIVSSSGWGNGRLVHRRIINHSWRLLKAMSWGIGYSGSGNSIYWGNWWLFGHSWWHLSFVRWLSRFGLGYLCISKMMKMRYSNFTKYWGYATLLLLAIIQINTCSRLSLRCFLCFEAGPFVKLCGSWFPPPLGGDSGRVLGGGGRDASKWLAAELWRFDGSWPSRLSWSAISLPAEKNENIQYR